MDHGSLPLHRHFISNQIPDPDISCFVSFQII